MDALINWATGYVAVHTQIASVLIIILGIDQVLKVVKNALKLNIPDNVFDYIGDILGKILSKSQQQPPKP